MTIWRTQSNRFWWKQLATTMLAIWLSGASCLLCCGPMEKSAAEAESCVAPVADNDSAAELCQEEACCVEKPSGDHSSSSETCNDECCILNAPASELPGNFKLNHVSAILSPAVLSPTSALPVKGDKLPFTQQHLPEGQKIHLRCCVFLI
ncbi:MAG: hypothetical protein ACKVZH_21200 [Blastocatellia bacterium]